jgi:hypothetical protein
MEMRNQPYRDLIMEVGGGSPDDNLTDLLKKSIALENEKRNVPEIPKVPIGRKKPFRPSWKTEYNSVFKSKEKLRVQRNLAIALTACYIFVDLLIKIFS